MNVAKRLHVLELTPDEQTFVDLWKQYGNRYRSVAMLSKALLMRPEQGALIVHKYMEIRRFEAYGEKGQLTPLRAARGQSRFRFEGHRK